MTANHLQDEEIRRLRWQCRRGMLELDVALLRFLDEDFRTLDADEQATFSRMLEAQDQTLHGWLMGRTQPEEADVQRLVARIRAFGRE
ncbi:MAG: succinate dehydrogenase assembly factor 2 [Chromatiaceae bacterium]|nr:succinate dehydrogenase assembly factor 2 [Chromatiaceae bacterium]MBP8024246.1 succinate dehydrogenase assembly factor 2 [Chromatiaceae bacterium]MBP9603560.1 succinate dehydrogenase assembly factor 2 [Chromatiaceae bacterium]